MQIKETEIPDVKLLEPRVFKDHRGFFFESYNQHTFDSLIGKRTFVQDNHSFSERGTLRGMHYQIHNTQGKLVRVATGEVFVAVVDLRKSSSMFGKWVGNILSAENQRLLWVPEGFAHGFLVLSKFADFLYKTTNFYDPSAERFLRWNDPAIGIKWPYEGTPNLCQRDSEAKGIKEVEVFP